MCPVPGGGTDPAPGLERDPRPRSAVCPDQRARQRRLGTAFERRYQITYPSIVTADSGEALLAFGPKLPPNAVPSTMIVDRQGRIAARVIGKTTYSTLTSLIEDTLAEP